MVAARVRRLGALALLLGSSLPPASAAGPPPPPLHELLDRAGRYVSELPTEMREAYGNRSRSAGEERVEVVARCSAWRRAEVEVKVILPER